MRLQIQSAVASQNRIIYLQKELPADPQDGRPRLIWMLVLFVVGCVVFAYKPFVETGPDGKLGLAKWRKEKLAKELKDLEEAEQYALLALRNGIYPCYSCPDGGTIALTVGQVWKYGFTTKSEKGRYQSSLESKNLMYFVQHEGTITECMQEERRKIYFYALLPENLVRPIPLIRPPGNKQDN